MVHGSERILRLVSSFIISRTEIIVCDLVGRRPSWL